MSGSVKLSQNFWSHEVSKTTSWSQLSNNNKMLVTTLCVEILQPTRDFLSKAFGKDVPVSITSGMRNASDVQRLRNQGYHPSVRSDHFFANAIPTESNSDKDRFGEFFTYGAGAADIVPHGIGVKEAFDAILDGVRSKYFNPPFGQLIHEFGGQGEGWLHLSNSKSLVMSPEMIEAVGFGSLNRIMTSPDAGKTYIKVEV